MKVRINRILSYLIAILIITSTCIFNIPIINNTSVLASEITEKGFTINDAIYGLIYYYDNEYYNNSKSNKTLEGLEYAAMYKANADLTKKNWSTNETIKTYGISGKAKQSIILMELDINPINYKGENSIEQVVEDLNKTTSIKFIQNILQEVLAVEMFNEKFPEQKINYNIKNIIDLILKEQDESGCIGGAIHNTAYAIEIFNKYSDINGVIEGKEKGINYLKSQIKDKGALYKDGGTYFTYIHAQAVRALLQAGEDVTSEKWSKDGYNIVDGLFYEWNGENFIDKYGKDRDINHYTEVLYTLSKLNELGYKDVFLKNIEFLNVVRDDTNQSKDEKVTINKVIDGVIDYYNEKHFIEEQGQLSDFHYSAMYRAGADLSEKNWYINEKYQTKYDMNWRLLGTKAQQSLILLDIDKNPNDYENRKFIEEIVKEIDDKNSYFTIPELNAVLAIDKYNSKFENEKVSYNVNKAIENILKAQCDDGGFKQRQTSTPTNTGIALTVLSKHRDINGVNEAIDKAINYLKCLQKENGAIYEKTYITNYYCDVLQGLIACGEDITSEKWTTTSGKNLIDGLFILWKDDNSFDDKEGESSNNRGWLVASQKALHRLVDIKNAGYSDYVIEDIKIKKYNDKEKQGNTCKVNVAIALPENGSYVAYFKPQEVIIDDEKHTGGFTALGALQASTSLYEITGSMVTSIYGYRNKGTNGWMYTVNGVLPNEMAGKVKLQEGDKVIWYYSTGGMNGKAPNWNDL
ncbi:DUF4430 domain-containing protein [Clostridium sp. ATCC 25772]|uniref:DUF4430 domain-containing protein n=1 Tax=Clostridium sp. ATCC 25772 TaxID=1676991 RepID=UPI000781A98D|nr:DUF4430 domain-containing protein [Clostridium sp. ATCC 25772]